MSCNELFTKMVFAYKMSILKDEKKTSIPYFSTTRENIELYIYICVCVCVCVCFGVTVLM